jgi:LPS export ABC transporter protein LptC
MKFLYLWTVLSMFLALSFERLYKNLSQELIREAGKISKSNKVAYGVTFTFFGNERALWLFKGEKVDMSDERKVIIEHFKAKNLRKFLKASSKKAIFYKRRNLLVLIGDVRIFLKKKTEPIEVRTSLVYVDLGKKTVYNTPKQRVVIKEPYRTIVGNGFQYSIESGELIILKDVQTFINGS